MAPATRLGCSHRAVRCPPRAPPRAPGGCTIRGMAQQQACRFDCKFGFPATRARREGTCCLVSPVGPGSTKRLYVQCRKDEYHEVWG
eukprot:scaffold20566_cov45-Phaeocystis_antarctica.AAC.1